MSVVHENSTQYANQIADPIVKNGPNLVGRPVKYLFEATRAVQGDIGSSTRLIKIPAGKVRVLGAWLKCSALGSSRTMDIGHAGYTQPDGTAVAAAEDAFLSAKDMSSAVDAEVVFGSGANVGIEIESRDGFVIEAQVEGGTHDAAETLAGWIEVMHIG